MSNIKKLRFDHKMSQEELAKHLNLTQTSVSAWETGKAQPDTQSLIMLSKLFCTSTDFILGLTNESGVVLNAVDNKAPVNQAGGNLTVGEIQLSNEEVEIFQTIRKSDMQAKVKIFNFFIELKKEIESIESKEEVIL